MSMSDRNKNYVPIMELLPYHKKIRGCFCYFFLAILSKIQSDKRQILRQYGFEIKTHRDYWNVNLLFELQSIVASAPCSTYKHCIYSQYYDSVINSKLKLSVEISKKEKEIGKRFFSQISSKVLKGYLLR